MRSRAKRTGRRRSLETAVEAFLDALGVDRADPNLRGTPRRVADAWQNEFVDGYAGDPARILAERFPVKVSGRRELVVVANLRFHSMCPHHLLPYQGWAHLAYLPGSFLVGFGRLSALLDCFAHRLILQEDLARSVARALATELRSPASACLVEAEQACLRMRGPCQSAARTYAEAYEGKLKSDQALRAELWARIGAKEKRDARRPSRTRAR